MSKFKILIFLIFSIFCLLKLFSSVQKEANLVWTSLSFLSFEKDDKGQDSKVVLIRDFGQFSKQIVNNPRPSIVRIYDKRISQDNMKENFQSLAGELSDFILFAAIDTNSSRQLTMLLQKILGFQPDQLPMIIFFKNGQMILPAFSGSISKENLFKIIKIRLGRRLIKVDRSSIEKNETNVVQDELPQNGNLDNFQESESKEKKEKSYWHRFKTFIGF